MLISSSFVDRGRDIVAMHVSVQKSPVSDMSGQRMNCQRGIARRTLQEEGGEGGGRRRNQSIAGQLDAVVL